MLKHMVSGVSCMCDWYSAVSYQRVEVRHTTSAHARHLDALVSAHLHQPLTGSLLVESARATRVEILPVFGIVYEKFSWL